ncbi:isochorismatase family protein [Glaciibacter flavus]|uniref:Isochorismatase family protein n=1 Tax=Orlajensenia flava TaxID=2565934 RepID=A0A4S4FWG4_9MICO|nr:isochorismatase family protein [Glaciibacter flavus]THG34265.1 isochorismatase family protein [Glaciibacter flavus]
MTITTLDPRTALVIIDLQAGVLALPTVHPAGDVLARALDLVDAFERRDLPVVTVTVSGGAPGRTEHPPRTAPRPAGWDALAPELQGRGMVVVKRTWGAFTGTDLDETLRALGVTQVVLAGISTSKGVESTARSAHELGYNVALATDAMTDSNPDAHDNSVLRIFPALGQTGSTAEIVALLGARAPR